MQILQLAIHSADNKKKLLKTIQVNLVIQQEAEVARETRKVSFKQQEVTVNTAASEMSPAVKSVQETQVQEQMENTSQG